MKKSKHIELILITALLSSYQTQQKDWEGSTNKTYIRSDSTAAYSRTHYYGGYYVFRPYGTYNNNRYNRVGYYSSAIHENSNIGTSATKSGIVRGGFGESGFSAGS